jgi:hypothetical protein
MTPVPIRWQRPEAPLWRIQRAYFLPGEVGRVAALCVLDCGFLFDVKRRTALDIHPTSMRFRPEGKKNILLVFESHIIFDMQLYFILNIKYLMHNNITSVLYNEFICK